MNNYNVELGLTGEVTYQIEAYSEEEAMEKARKIAKSKRSFAPQATMGEELQTACNPYYSEMSEIIKSLCVSVDLDGPISAEIDVW